MIQHSARTRYYVHGDHHEKTPNMYYCARCDLFEPAQHFEDVEHVSTRAQRYEQSLQSWERYAKKRNSKLYRPPDAENIIAELAAADVRAEKAARSQFYRWILRQTKRVPRNPNTSAVDPVAFVPFGLGYWTLRDEAAQRR
jgi:hypothetical protein